MVMTPRERAVHKFEANRMSEAIKAGLRELRQDCAALLRGIPDNVIDDIWMHGFASGGEYEADRAEGKG